MKKTKTGGLLLVIGTVMILVTILFEYQIGWIGTERPAEQVPLFMLDNWPALQWIWGWQMTGYILFIFAFIALLPQANQRKKWLLILQLLSALLMVVAFAITLACYLAALEVHSSNPDAFRSIRSLVMALYSPGRLGLLLFLVLFLWEMFETVGALSKKLGLWTWGVVLTVVLIGSLLGIPIKVSGTAWFLFPLVLGYGYWRR